VRRDGRARGKGTLIVMTAIAAPVALAFETLLRKLLFPPYFEELREALRPTLTPVAWTLCAVAVAAGAFGIAFQRRLARRAVARLPEDRRSPEEVDRARIGAFMLAASVPQIPAIASTFSFMFGASLVPVIVGIVLVTVAVGIQAWRTRAA